MQSLNFPAFEFRTRLQNGRNEIFDPVRRRFVALTPEEWVRQHLILLLHQVKGYPLSVLGVEKQLLLNRQPKRFDLVIFRRNGEPLLLAECKAPGIEISEKTFDQAARYNLLLHAEYFLITNGMDHYTCRLDYEHRRYVFIPDIPDFQSVKDSFPG
jgi:hypothetical protein